MRLLTAAAAGNGAESTVPRRFNKREMSCVYTLYVFGTFDGATMTLQISPTVSGNNWFTVTGVSVTAAGVINCEFRAARVRGVVTGGTAPAIDAILL